MVSGVPPVVHSPPYVTPPPDHTFEELTIRYPVTPVHIGYLDVHQSIASALAINPSVHPTIPPAYEYRRRTGANASRVPAQINTQSQSIRDAEQQPLILSPNSSLPASPLSDSATVYEYPNAEASPSGYEEYLATIAQYRTTDVPLRLSTNSRDRAIPASSEYSSVESSSPDYNDACLESPKVENYNGINHADFNGRRTYTHYNANGDLILSEAIVENQDSFLGAVSI
ncbi:hypothetical protein BKA69DRAFT_1059432, partial [Paraphysoderma sedebokerense]